MAINLLDPGLWVEKLKNDCPIFSERVFETVEDDNAALEFYASPLALVYVSGDNSDPSSTMNRINQLHASTITVKIAVRKTTNKSDRLSAENSQLIRACRLEVLNALLGWLPPDCKKPVEHVGGELTIKGDFILWTDKFTTNDYLRR